MAINTYKFSYETNITDSSGKIYDNYINNAKNHIREETNNPNFEFLKYFRISAIYEPINDVTENEYRFTQPYKVMINGNFDYVEGYNTVSSIEIYSYNKRDTLLEYPETNLSDMIGLENGHAIQHGNIYCKVYDKVSGAKLSAAGWKYKCSVIVTYSDDDPSAGDEYVEPEKPKKIYLANLDFGYRRSRRNNKNRRKYRNWY